MSLTEMGELSTAKLLIRADLACVIAAIKILQSSAY